MVHHHSNKLIISDFLKEQHYILLTFSALIMFMGIAGIIEHKSPEDLASLTILSQSFINSIEFHFLIFAGALGVTISFRNILNS
ncbi:MAG: hypothetical protein HQL46_00585 [Gammaproteobacteria bacterium]|nr:hypothetical protein [Gammaproteobacteria bacterium]